jgi:FkbM family methyltransferase
VKELFELVEYYSSNENLTNKLIDNFLKEAENKKVCIFGAGLVGKGMAYSLENEGINVDFFCDNDMDKVGKTYTYYSIPCFSYEKLKLLKGETVVLVCAGKAFDIIKQLEADNIHYYLSIEFKFKNRNFWNKNNISDFRNKIIESYNLFEDEFSKKVFLKFLSSWFDGDLFTFKEICSPDQYFMKEIKPLGDHETFIDIGSFEGDTIDVFLNTVNKNFNKIYAFELNKESFEKLTEYVNKLPLEVSSKIELNNIGISQNHESLYYDSCGASSSILSDVKDIKNNLIETNLAPLDDVIEDNVTLIKMDIEGSELSALKGAKKIIQKQKPKLAICIYHKPSDLWEIPLYIKELNPDYRLFLRHHTQLEYETVCYAV